MRIQLRELISLMTGVAFALALNVLLIRSGDDRTTFLLAAWAIGSITGIVASSRFMSVLWGGLLGGGSLPVMLYLYFAACGAMPFSSLALFMVGGVAAILSASQAALMGIIGEGFRPCR